MTYTITNQCIACDRCLSACPTGAIQRYGQHYWINAERCNNCEGHYGIPQCWASCPTNEGCVPFLSGITAVAASSIQSPLSGEQDDYWDNWFATYNRLVSRLRVAKRAAVWEQWFDVYSQQLSNLLVKRRSQFTEVQP
jgi:ferredoxin